MARVWDARSGECVMRFEGHDGDINAVRFFPSGDALGTACNDGTVSHPLCWCGLKPLWGIQSLCGDSWIPLYIEHTDLHITSYFY